MVAVSAVLLLSPFAQATSPSPVVPPALVWSDSQGLLELQNCQKTVSGREFADFAERIVEIQSSQFQLQVHGFSLPLNESFWQMVAADPTAESSANGGIEAVICFSATGSKTYVMFDVFVPEMLSAVARIGVNLQEALIFQKRILHTVDEAEKLIAERVQTRPNRLLQQKQMQSAQSVPSSSIVAGLDVQNGSLQYVLCLSHITLNVRDESLNNIIFEADHLQSVKPVQSFGQDRQQKVINGVNVQFIKVQFPERSTNNVGWVAESYVQLTSQCTFSKQVAAVTSTQSQWVFPTVLRPSESYKTGMRRFRASRSGGRLHAACDLYRVLGEPALAINSGIVVRDRYYFYEGTYAMEVKHAGGRIARYGEITGKVAPGVAQGSVISPGQTVAYIAKVNSGCCTPMLHFEMYSGAGTGALTQPGTGFQRRSDLLDPSNDLMNWEMLKFGHSF